MTDYEENWDNHSILESYRDDARDLEKEIQALKNQLAEIAFTGDDEEKEKIETLLEEKKEELSAVESKISEYESELGID
jgi:ribosomal protein L10